MNSLWVDASRYNFNTFSINFEDYYIDLNGYFDNIYDCKILHEYFHLIQNATTIFGLWSFMNRIDLFFDYANVSKKNLDINKLRRPFNLNKKLAYSNYIKDLHKIIFRTNEDCPKKVSKNVKFKKFHIHQNNISTPYNKDLPYDEVYAEFDDSGKIFSTRLMVMDIMEPYSISAECELTMPYSGITNTKDPFYYHSARIILDNFFPNIKESNVAVILHWSLNDINPMRFFVEIIEFLKTKYAANSLPNKNILSQEIFQNCFLPRRKYLAVDFLLGLNGMVKKFGNNDYMKNVLNSVYIYFFNNLTYLIPGTANYGIIPCLKLYPFDKITFYVSSLCSGPCFSFPLRSLPLNFYMQYNCSYVSLPMYYRNEDAHAYSLTTTPYCNYFSVESFIKILDYFITGKLVENCPFDKETCNLPCKCPKCKKWFYRMVDCDCPVGCALKYFA